MIEVPPDPATGIRIGICVILGPGDSGKTTLAAVMVREWLPPGQEERLVVVGPVQKLAEILGVPNHPVDTKDKAAQEAFFHKVNEIDGAMLIAVDEADLYYSMGGRTYGSKEFQELVNIGRNFGKSLILCARGTSDLAKNTINQARVVFMANTGEANLLDYAERYMDEKHVGVGGSPNSREYICSLEPHEFLVWCPKMNPRWQGTARVIGGALYLVPPTNSPTNQTPSENSTDGEGATSPDERASSPGADSSSRTDSGPTSATTITLNG